MTATRKAGEPILAVSDVTKRFGGLRAVDRATFAVARGSITALIGPNGAGKTTLLDLVSGYERPDLGAVRFEGRRIDGLASYRVARRGVVRTFQLTRVFAAMSVRDNMMLGAQRHPGEGLHRLAFSRAAVRRAEAAARERAERLLRAFALDAKASEYAGALSGGQRKLLEFARALMAEPRLVLLDEPMAGVNRALGRQAPRRSRAPTARGGHDVPLHRARYGHRHAARRPGRRHGGGSGRRRRNSRIHPSGSPGHRRLSRPQGERGVSEASALAVADLVAGYSAEVDILKGVSIALAPREIVTVVGPNGAGKSTLIKAVFGLIAPKAGRVLLAGESIAGLRPSAIARRGVGYVPQRENVFSSLTVAENLEIGLAAAPNQPLNRRCDAMYALFPRLAERRRQKVDTMSGGERQMVAMARALMPEPSVLLLDEPSAGLAPILVDAMFEQIRAINREGIAILMVEQNARQALALSDRGYVLDLGRNAHEGRGQEMIDDPRIAELYLGAAAPADNKDHPK